MWRRSDAKRFKKTFPRSDEPWKLAEDRRLLRAYDRGRARLAKLPHGERYAWWVKLAKPFGRTKEAVQARVNGLCAGRRAVRAMR